MAALLLAPASAYLPYWVGFVGAAAVFGSSLAFFFPERIRKDQFALQPKEVTPLAARLFSAWTILASAVRISYFFYPADRGLFMSVYASFVIVLGFYSNEIFIAKTAPVMKSTAIPLFISVTSLTWMTKLLLGM
eukprot:TRINITY_DN14069_c0_g1_i1.p1 TRINITY_DN14069_c0_g1~~TRINITY_DN14069_c0_g1_i1.p1  ORF type:complete len:134 (-),score=34.00 TRINITY_DN14069_c0_g1_i1:60-461(-)